MSRKRWIAIGCALALAVAALIAYVAYVRSGPHEPKLCEVCRRPIMPRTAFSVEVGRRTLWWRRY